MYCGTCHSLPPLPTCSAHICQAASLMLPKEEATNGQKRRGTEGTRGASEGQLKERSLATRLLTILSADSWQITYAERGNTSTAAPPLTCRSVQRRNVLFIQTHLETKTQPKGEEGVRDEQSERQFRDFRPRALPFASFVPKPGASRAL